MGPKIKVHPMCQAMARTQLKYVTLAHDGVNAVLSTTQVPLPTPRPFSVETGVLHYHESTCSCKPTLPRGSGGCSCNSFKLAPTQDPPTISFGTDSPKYDLGGSSPVFKTVPSGQTQTVLTDLNSPKNLAENVIQIPNCRKCGGEPMLRTHDNRFIRWSWVECTGCPCRTNVAGSDFQAIQEWKRGDVICDKPAAGESEVTSTTASTSSAVESFRQAIRANSSLAWSWHCNIAVLLQDHGMSHEASNRCTADVMLRLFDIDVTVFDEWNLFHWATPSAAEVFRKALGADSEWAWTWHCNIAMPLQDHHGMSHEKANRCAADLMLYLFDVDVTRFDEWLSFPWATPSAAVGADIVPRAEYDKAVELLCQIGDIAHDASNGPERPDTYWDIRQMAYGFRECVERVPSDSKPTNVPESEDTPPRGNDVPATENPFRLEYGKRYVRDDENVTDPLERTAPESQKGVTHPFRCPKYDITYDEDGSHVAGEQCPCNLVAEYIEPEPFPPAESPDDWVTQDRVPARPGIDERRWVHPGGFDSVSAWDDASCMKHLPHLKHGWSSASSGTLLIRCRRKDLPPVPVVPKTRTVTLREYEEIGNHSVWSTSVSDYSFTGRTCESEVPE